MSDTTPVIKDKDIVPDITAERRVVDMLELEMAGTFHPVPGLSSENLSGESRAWAHLRRFLRLRAIDDGPVDFLPIPLLPPPSPSGDAVGPSPEPVPSSHDTDSGVSLLSELVFELNRQEGRRWYLLTVPFRRGIPVWQSIFPPDEFAGELAGDFADGLAAPTSWGLPEVPLSLLIVLEAIEQEGWRPILFLRNLPLSDLGAQSLLLQLARRHLWDGKLPSGTVVVAETDTLGSGPDSYPAAYPIAGSPGLPSVLRGSIFRL